MFIEHKKTNTHVSGSLLRLQKGIDTLILILQIASIPTTFKNLYNLEGTVL